MKKVHSNYPKAIAWFVLSLIVSCGNDAITKYIGAHTSAWQIAFFRCLFGAISLLPWMLYQGASSFKTQRPLLHVVRGGLLFAAIGLWSHGVKTSPITTATIMSFTVPIFVLLLAHIFLKEHVTWPMWAATLIGFLGITLVLQPSHCTYQPSALCFLLAAALFGTLDVINKKYVTQEPMHCMLFYSSLVATMLLAPPAAYGGPMPTGNTLLWLFALGIGSNLILYFVLKAFSWGSVSSLAPVRYLELLISMGAGYLFFQELPSESSYLGAAIIIPCTLFIVWYQSCKAEE